MFQRRKKEVAGRRTAFDPNAKGEEVASRSGEDGEMPSEAFRADDGEAEFRARGPSGEGPQASSSVLDASSVFEAASVDVPVST